MTIALWIVQVLLAALFVFAGVMKLLMPIQELTQQTGMSAWFIRFISIAEVLGGIGVILPGVLRILPGLVPLAAVGLVIIMIGATLTTMATMGVSSAVIPLVVGIFAAFVAYGRWRVAPIAARG